MLFANKWLIIDLSALVARSSLVRSQQLTTAAGLPSGHIYRLFRSLLKVKQNIGGTMVFALEGKDQTRYKVFPEYKANRREKREAQDTGILFDPGPSCRAMCELFKGKRIWQDGSEADDAIAAFVKEHANDRMTLISSDQDLWALMKYSKLTIVTRDTKRKIDRKVTKEDLSTKFGCLPENLALMKAVMGDTSDGIPKVKGLKRKDILQAFDTEDELDADQLLTRLAGTKSQVALQDHLGQIKQMHMVTLLRENSGYDEVDQPGDKRALLELLERYECTSLFPSAEFMAE